MSLCKQCVSGKTHEGTPQGTILKIGGVDCYVATPTGDYRKDCAVLFLADALGPQHVNSQLLVDDFARNGYQVIAPDYFAGEPVPVTVVKDDFSLDPSYDLGAWVARHNEASVRPILDKVIEALKVQGITRFGATGYCFGGRYVFDLAFENITSVSIASHPSLLNLPEDLHTYFAKSKAPLLLNTCPIDGQFPPSAQAQADEILGEGKFKPGYQREFWDGCEHGFAVRGDLKNESVKRGMEGSFKASVEWFGRYL